MDQHGWNRDQTKLKTKTFKGPRPGATFQRPEQDYHLDYFLLFFPIFLFPKIVKYTNKTVNPKFRAKTTMQEIKAWFGIRILQGVHPTPTTGQCTQASETTSVFHHDTREILSPLSCQRIKEDKSLSRILLEKLHVQ